MFVVLVVFEGLVLLELDIFVGLVLLLFVMDDEFVVLELVVLLFEDDVFELIVSLVGTGVIG